MTTREHGTVFVPSDGGSTVWLVGDTYTPADGEKMLVVASKYYFELLPPEEA